MDKEIREKIHFVAIRDLEDTEPGQVYCNCGLKWPCPVLRLYEDAENPMAWIKNFMSEDNGFPELVPARPPMGFIWLCACGHLNRYVIGEQFCSGCRHENPVCDAVYAIDPIKHWPHNLRKS